MSAVCVLTPILIASWPVISSAIVSAAASLGFAVATRPKEEQVDAGSNRVQTDLPNSDILSGNVGEEARMVIEKDGVTVTFTRDARGACKLCVSGEASKKQLEKIGQEVAGKVTQQFAYHKLVTELKARDFAIVEEKVQQDDSIRIRIRRGG